MGNIINKSDVKAYLDIQHTNDDTLISNLIDRAESFVESYLNKKVAKQTNKVDRFNGAGQREFVLPYFPIQGINKFQYNNGDLDNPKWEDFNSNDYSLDDKKGIIYTYHKLPRGIKNIKVDYNVGYDPVPGDIIQAHIIIVAYMYNHRQADGVNQEQIEGGSINYVHNKIPTEAKALLEPHKNIQFLSIG